MDVNSEITTAHLLEWLKFNTWQHQKLERMWSNRNSHLLLIGMQMTQPLWQTVWQFLAKLNLVLTLDLATVFLGIYPNELNNYVHIKTCTLIFIIL